MEGLCLKSTHKGNPCVDKMIHRSMWDRDEKKQKCDLQNQDDMPPFNKTVIPDADMYLFSQKNTAYKRKNRQRIIKCIPIILFCQTHAQQNKISGLTVGKDFASAEISIGVQKSACYGKKHPDDESFRNPKLLCPVQSVCIFAAQNGLV